ncbi:putative C2 domain protein [Trypanosoma equiperdum]|uniref:Predicted C2 domain protein n=1 Tax=Trypanosoma equiperdum TaxID=5694 RepID=A0A1G4I412_TRYEQ|nr:predicted C2 domain protein [Trypanosoma equiperdum]
MATLTVTVHEARDLPVMDRTTGLADTYVVVKLDDLEYTTDISRMSCHPVWNRVFRFDTPDLLVLQEDPLEVRVYDHDIFSRDDIVGHTFVDLNSMVLKSNASMSGWFPLFDTSTEGIRGEIRLTLKIKFHTAENPLAPRLPKRYVCKLPSPQNTRSPHTRGETSQQPQAVPSAAFMQMSSDLEPLRAARAQHPSFTMGDEGVLIFSAWRLDPSVYRVETMLTMVEELIVKADPEHSKLTNLRSTRSTNEARIIQLYKLSGKVRRQLARKVVEMQCNAVLGYVEEFDMEANGIIVRAYGTPCVLSAVKFVDPGGADTVPAAQIQVVKRLTPPMSDSPVAMHCSMPTPLQMPPAVGHGDLAGNNVVAMNIRCLEQEAVQAAQQPQQQRLGISTAAQQTSSFHGTSALIPFVHESNSPGATRGDNPSMESLPPAPTGMRTNVLLLTVKDLPCGTVEHVGGHISAMSVKIVAKMKSRHLISQERDAWWMELREELRANARAFHCNVVIGYEEAVLYHEDVVVLSLFGTAVMLNLTLHPLRCGPELLYQSVRKRFAARKACSLLHLYAPVVRYKDATEEDANQFMCNVCHSRLVPEVLLTSCAMPQELIYRERPRLVQAVVTKEKSAIRGVGLALAVSQALPYIEYSLHKQLLFNLKFQKLNAVFGIRITLSISHDTIIGTLTGTGCCLVGLPVPSPPRVEVLDPAIRNKESVIRLEAVAEQLGRSRHHRLGGLAMNIGARFANSNLRGSDSSCDPFEVCADDFMSDHWDDNESFGGSCSNHEPGGAGKADKTTDYIVKIDDEEEAEMMLGMIGDLSFEDSLMVTIPYVPESANMYGSQERVVLNTRFALPRTYHGATAVATVSECVANAKRSYVQTVCRAALRRCGRSSLSRLCVTSYACDFFFEPNSGELHLRMEGCLMTCTTEQQTRLMELEKRSFSECMRYLDADTKPVDHGSNSHGETHMVDGLRSPPLGSSSCGAGPAPQDAEPRVFTMSNAPYTLPYVFKVDAVNPAQWWNERIVAPVSAPSDAFEFYSDNRRRHGVIGRKLRTFASKVTAFVGNILKPTGSQTNRRPRSNAQQCETTPISSEVAGGGYLLHEPMRRIPSDPGELEAGDPVVIFTSQDFVAGQAIKRYVGRLSQHFIREAYEVDNSTDLGIFFQQTEIEMQCMVQAMVILMGGNALLKHRVTYHEVWDSDGSGCASLFATVTGDVVETCATPLVPLPCGGTGDNSGEPLICGY